MRIGIIDCGTNTFNLLVGDLGERWQKVFSTKVPVMLGHGLNEEGIRPTRFARGIDAMRTLREIAINYRCDRLEAIGTSALREANNGREFTETASELTGIDIRVISGSDEAQFIYRGVSPLLGNPGAPDLIMDIGGGSTEFVLCDDEKVLWSHSYRLGVASIWQRIRPEDPLTEQNKEDLRALLEAELSGLVEACLQHQPARLIGSSGSFDTFVDMLIGKEAQQHHFNEIGLDDFSSLRERLIQSSKRERLLMKGMIPLRADTIGMAAFLVGFVLEKANISALHQSAFALKEGVIASIAAGDWNDY